MKNAVGTPEFMEHRSGVHFVGSDHVVNHGTPCVPMRRALNSIGKNESILVQSANFLAAAWLGSAWSIMTRYINRFCAAMLALSCIARAVYPLHAVLRFD